MLPPWTFSSQSISVPGGWKRSGPRAPQLPTSLTSRRSPFGRNETATRLGLPLLSKGGGGLALDWYLGLTISVRASPQKMGPTADPLAGGTGGGGSLCSSVANTPPQRFP